MTEKDINDIELVAKMQHTADNMDAATDAMPDGFQKRVRQFINNEMKLVIEDGVRAKISGDADLLLELMDRMERIHRIYEIQEELD